ncbi:hypothetical protein SETIT_9G355600v2 [Setaria italica]|uniref:Uncharacterized protein n=1 Tax=Setaria italica TaxID=4555 RepID=A0A368SR24_SETIT|nr:hypothetical protein SETIT_9G355600v2 [Setaria italica]
MEDHRPVRRAPRPAPPSIPAAAEEDRRASRAFVPPRPGLARHAASPIHPWRRRPPRAARHRRPPTQAALRAADGGEASASPPAYLRIRTSGPGPRVVVKKGRKERRGRWDTDRQAPHVRKMERGKGGGDLLQHFKS